MNRMVPIFIIAFLFYSFASHGQEQFPGGVPGAEAWYIATPFDNGNVAHQNHGTPHIVIKSCYEEIGEPYLFNFNPSFMVGKLCLKYKAALENTTSRNIFFVGEPRSNEDYSHLTTSWNETLNPMPTSMVRNRFDLAIDAALASQQSMEYQSVSNANVNFYNWNVYQTDRKFKSYGFDGETNFYIGRDFLNDTINAKSYRGNFPEFISFPFELTANQRNRVDSYLALKYGISLNKDESYRSSKNVVFWKQRNNKLFGDRIFGLGRDDISGLHQLISESVHEKDLLVASVGEWAETNEIKQASYRMRNGNFIVYGDNDKKLSVDPEYQGKIKKIGRIWLSQNTGEDAANYDIGFKFNIVGSLRDRLMENPSQKIWMMRDKYAGYQAESSFQGNGIDYYPATNIEGDFQYAIFSGIFFDQDWSIHDQFTFGIGPEMIVQVQLTSRGCDPKFINGKVVISGGVAPYDLTITNSNGYYENIVVQDNFYVFQPDMNASYEITVVDSNGVHCQENFSTDLPQITVDLGPDQVLSSSQLQITLDGSPGVMDPGATYSWFMDGTALDQYTPSITVTEPGYYYVVITSGNGMCQMSDGITISYTFSGSVESFAGCGDTTGSIIVSLSGGTAPFTTLVLGPNQNLSLVHSSDNVTIGQLEFGQHTLTVTDANGTVFQQNVTLEDPLSVASIDLIAQLDYVCQSWEDPNYAYPWIDCNAFSPLPLDASVPNSNATYEWFRNGLSLGIYTPHVDVAYTSDADGDINEITVVVTDSNSGCSTTDGFIIKGKYAVYPGGLGAKQNMAQNNQILNNGDYFLDAMVYPNPSAKDAPFNYTVKSSEIFSGTVNLYTPLGVLLKQVVVSGESSYTLKFDLQTSGVYFICTRTNGKIVTDKIVIK